MLVNVDDSSLKSDFEREGYLVLRGFIGQDKVAEVLGFSQGITDFGSADREHEIVMRAQPGDLLVHHCLTIHLADGNASSRTRKAMGLNYFSQRAKQDPQRIALFRQQVNKNLFRAGKI